MHLDAPTDAATSITTPLTACGEMQGLATSHVSMIQSTDFARLHRQPVLDQITQGRMEGVSLYFYKFTGTIELHVGTKKVGSLPGF